jgi:hypothetical protein
MAAAARTNVMRWLMVSPFFLARQKYPGVIDNFFYPESDACSVPLKVKLTGNVKSFVL